MFIQNIVFFILNFKHYVRLYIFYLM
jgi:hypothetical protein